MRYPTWIWLCLMFLAIIACDLEQEIDIELPDYTSQPMVECYLQPGSPFSLLLTRSSRYFDPFPSSNAEFLESLLLDSAEVYIRFNGRTVQLENRLAFNPFTRRVTNYNSNEVVPVVEGTTFELEIILPTRQVITASTVTLPVVPIDSVVVEYAPNDTLARALTYFTDRPDTQNYYRRMLHSSSIDSLPEQDFTVDDRFVDSVFVFGSGYNFKAGSLLINTLVHIDKAYFDFLESVNNASNSNGNPFSQPSPIISNLESPPPGAIGIFTGLSLYRMSTIVPPQ